VVEAAPDLGLTQEALEELGIVEQVPERPFQRRELPAALGLVDRSHPAFAQHLEQTEFPEPFLAPLVDPPSRIHDSRWRRRARGQPPGGSLVADTRLLRAPERNPGDHHDEADRHQREGDQAGAGPDGHGGHRPQRGVDGGGAPRRDVDVMDRVLVFGARHAHAMAAGCQSGLHQAPALRVGRAHRLVVDVHRGSRRLREDLERSRGRSRGGGGRTRPAVFGRRWRPRLRRRLAARSVLAMEWFARGRLRGRRCGGSGGRRRRRRGCFRRQRGDGGRGRRGRGRRRRRPALRHGGVDADRDLVALVGRLLLPERGRLVERLARGVQLAEAEVGLGETDVREVARLDVRAVGQDVAPRLRAQGDGALEGRRRPGVVPARQGREPGAVRLVPFLRARGRGDEERQCQGESRARIEGASRPQKGSRHGLVV